jgi:hypothetical protein
MKEIKLTQGFVALVDDEDFEYLDQFKWYAHKGRNSFYAHRNIKTGVDKQTTILMHKEIIKTKLHIDHIDHNGLNNQKINLRECTCQQNCMNRNPHKNSYSEYKGVSYIKRLRKWQASICISQKQKYLGIYKSEIEAARAYNKTAIELFGVFSNINKLNQDDGKANLCNNQCF